MTKIARAWSKVARERRRRRGDRDDAAWEEKRLEWVRRNASGRSFVDVGGMFKYMGDIAFLAEESGATKVSLLDVGDPDVVIARDPGAGVLVDKIAAKASKVRYVQANLEDPDTPALVGPHEVAFFSGVLYHTPHPFQQLAQLHEFVTELLYLSTLTIPEVPGFPQACIFYPYLTPEDRQPFAAGYHWAPSLLAIGADTDERPMFGYGNCWWGITPSALDAMLRAARWEVVERLPQPHEPFMTELVCRPVDADPLLPPVTYFRERGEAREQWGERLPYETWYDELRTRRAPVDAR